MTGPSRSAVKDEACLYAAMRCPRESHDRLLRDLIAPLVREIRGHPDLDSLFFIRYDDPEWQIRFRVLGRPSWTLGPLRERVEAALRPFLESGVILGVEFGEYAREWDRYGGPLGMRLAEKVFHHDSLACLDILEAEARGGTKKPRREHSLVFTEHFLDLFGFDSGRRMEFYRSGHEWAFRDGVFKAEDIPRLEQRYEATREGLRDVLCGEQSRDPSLQYGGAEPARIALGCLHATGPVVRELLEARASGRIPQDLVQLAWSFTHLHCNRLGIELVPEAILRYLMFRFYEERLGSPGPSSCTRSSVA